MAGQAVTASDKAKKFVAEVFNAAGLPADAMSRYHRGKRGARIEQRREDRTQVSKHQNREGDRRGVSGLLPPSRWHLGKYRAGRREIGRGKYSKKIGGWKGESRTLGRGDVGGFERLLRNYDQMQGLGPERGNSSWVRSTSAHSLSRARTA